MMFSHLCSTYNSMLKIYFLFFQCFKLRIFIYSTNIGNFSKYFLKSLSLRQFFKPSNLLFIYMSNLISKIFFCQRNYTISFSVYPFCQLVFFLHETIKLLLPKVEFGIPNHFLLGKNQSGISFSYKLNLIFYAKKCFKFGFQFSSFSMLYYYLKK